MIVLMAGLPGSGKTTLATELARLTHGALLSKDVIRAAMFAPEIEYSAEQDDFVMEIMLQAAAWLLRKNPARSIFLDGRTFSRRYQIDLVLDFAKSAAQPWRIVECVCPEDTARHRLSEPDPAHPAHNRSFDLYREVRSRFETITHVKRVVDTGQPLETCVQEALQHLGGHFETPIS